MVHPFNDLQNEYESSVTLSAGNFTSATDGGAVDMAQKTHPELVVHIDSFVSAGTVTIYLEESADGSSGWSELASATFGSSDSDSMKVVRSDARKLRYVRGRLAFSVAPTNFNASGRIWSHKTIY